METDPFKEYLQEVEPDRQYGGYARHITIGLQAVDGPKTSDYLVHTAIKSTEGEIIFTEANVLLNAYYAAEPVEDALSWVEEVDKVSVRAAALLSEKAFSFTSGKYLGIHRRLFSGIYPHAGQICDYNITKKKWASNSAMMFYGSATELETTLEYGSSEERQFSYRGLSLDEIVAHLAVFMSHLWQVYVSVKGNTRTTAVFSIKYLRTLDFGMINDIFTENTWYFRNALVRADYSDLKNEVHATTEYLELSLRSLLSGKEYPLQNRILYVSLGSKVTRKSDIEANKPDIDSGKPDINEEKPDIVDALLTKAIQQAMRLREALPGQEIFDHAEVIRILGIKVSRGFELLKQLLEHGVIEAISGCGKGKYCLRTPA